MLTNLSGENIEQVGKCDSTAIQKMIKQTVLAPLSERAEARTVYLCIRIAPPQAQAQMDGINILIS